MQRVESVNLDWTKRKRLANILATLTAVVALPLLLSGGSVTSYNVGMAVPDWPTTMGQNMFTFNFLAEAFGVQVEHLHRLFGSAVGFLAIATLATMWWANVSRRVFWMSVISLTMVCIQGVIGGQRVVLNALLGKNLALVHGVFGQLTFSVLVSVAIQSSKRWLIDQKVESEIATNVRLSSAILVGLYFAQIVAGAFLRHLGQGLMVHLILAGVVFLMTLRQVAIILLSDLIRPIMGFAAKILGGLIVVQLGLGLAAYFITASKAAGTAATSVHVQALIPTLHVVTGAMLLATSGVVLLDAYRRLKPTTVPHTAPLGLSLEAAR